LKFKNIPPERRGGFLVFGPMAAILLAWASETKKVGDNDGT
jgi:hypothetical protein